MVSPINTPTQLPYHEHSFFKFASNVCYFCLRIFPLYLHKAAYLLDQLINIQLQLVENQQEMIPFFLGLKVSDFHQSYGGVDLPTETIQYANNLLIPSIFLNQLLVCSQIKQVSFDSCAAFLKLEASDSLLEQRMIMSDLCGNLSPSAQVPWAYCRVPQSKRVDCVERHEKQTQKEEECHSLFRICHGIIFYHRIESQQPKCNIKLAIDTIQTQKSMRLAVISQMSGIIAAGFLSFIRQRLISGCKQLLSFEDTLPKRGLVDILLIKYNQFEQGEREGINQCQTAIFITEHCNSTVFMLIYKSGRKRSIQRQNSLFRLVELLQYDQRLSWKPRMKIFQNFSDV